MGHLDTTETFPPRNISPKKLFRHSFRFRGKLSRGKFLLSKILACGNLPEITGIPRFDNNKSRMSVIFRKSIISWISGKLNNAYIECTNFPERGQEPKHLDFQKILIVFRSLAYLLELCSFICLHFSKFRLLFLPIFPKCRSFIFNYFLLLQRSDP